MMQKYWMAGACLAAMLMADAAFAADPAPAADIGAGDAGDIVVTGTRQGEAKAISTKKEALNIVEALYANDVGKLPDQNVAEAVKRLPGLTVANDQGEGRYVVIRGINPNLVNVTLNGLTLPAPEPDGRQVKLDDIPSALISSVVVTKAITADQDANAIGGAVDIRTLGAFDRNKSFFLDARAAYGWAKLGENHPWEGDAQVGGIFGSDGQFGAVLSFNYSKRPIESENFQGSANWRATATAAGVTRGFVVPDNYGLRDYNLTRKRLGAVANFDWHPDDVTKVWLRTSYSKFDDNEVRDQNLIENQTFSAAQIAAQTATTGSFTGRGSIRIRRRIEKDNTKSVQSGGTFQLGTGTLDISGAFTRATKKDPLRSEYNIRTGGTALTVNYDLTNSPFVMTATNTPALTAYTLNSVNYDRRLAVETLWQGRADYTLPIGLGDESNIKFGGKYLDRHKTNNRDYETYSLTAGRTFTLANAAYTGSTTFYDGDYAFGPRISYDTAQAYLAANPGTITLNRASSIANALANDYDAKERIAAGYVMATLKFGGLTLLPGVRIENTRDKVRGKLITAASALDQGFNSSVSKSYTDFFPSLSAKFSVTPAFVLRGAVTTAIGRPNYPDLSPYQSVDTTTTPRPTITLGNPDVKPYKAVSADIAAEYYLPGSGIVSLGFFYKHLKNPIYTLTVINTSGTFAGQTFANADLVQAQNLDHANLKGIEANLQKRFDFLPSPLDGFGIAANYTRVTGHATSGLTGVSRITDAPLFLQSKNSGTVQVFYEKYGAAIRVAYTYRSKYLDTLGTDASTDQYTDHNGQLDVNASYQVSPQLTFFANATNLTDAAWRRFVGVKNQLIERERYDYTVRWGAQLHF
ncbi:TonB-dependent receptor [Sphingomonas sp. BIUV-7]|uniref:TonB-dependent receptor n=1 Tax=Sphingomonas natans TaxID=3063330 RepID=A0ABT8Y9G7_9SPHN|nr:TonB-dependent receptor [Sphingomonas sp. BIUV-7]MDO6414977.1 TonB-dependent receptor [Sphingomonas sp. BIUV-7]